MAVHEHLVILASAYFEKSSKSFQKNGTSLSRFTLKVLFKSLVCSSLEYADVVWDGCSESGSNLLLDSLQIEGARVVISALKETTRVSLWNKLSWVNLSVRRKLHKLSLMYKIVFKLSPPYLCYLCPDFISNRSCYSLHSARNICLPYIHTDRHSKIVSLFSSMEVIPQYCIALHAPTVHDIHVISELVES